MAAASHFGDEFLSSLLDESIEFTALLVYFTKTIIPLALMGPFDLEG